MRRLTHNLKRLWNHQHHTPDHPTPEHQQAIHAIHQLGYTLPDAKAAAARYQEAAQHNPGGPNWPHFLHMVRTAGLTNTPRPPQLHTPPPPH